MSIHPATLLYLPRYAPPSVSETHPCSGTPLRSLKILKPCHFMPFRAIPCLVVFLAFVVHGSKKRPASEEGAFNVWGFRTEWSGREDLNLRPLAPQAKGRCSKAFIHQGSSKL